MYPGKNECQAGSLQSNGIKLRTLVDEVKETGTYQVEFKADRLEVGEYICKLESDYYFETKKMVLNK